jgi:hypothetical protein
MPVVTGMLISWNCVADAFVSLSPMGVKAAYRPALVCVSLPGHRIDDRLLADPSLSQKKSDWRLTKAQKSLFLSIVVIEIQYQ